MQVGSAVLLSHLKFSSGWYRILELKKPSSAISCKLLLTLPDLVMQVITGFQLWMPIACCSVSFCCWVNKGQSWAHTQYSSGTFTSWAGLACFIRRKLGLFSECFLFLRIFPHSLLYGLWLQLTVHFSLNLKTSFGKEISVKRLMPFTLLVLKTPSVALWW